MTHEELKSELSKIDLPTTFRMSAWENITNVERFLANQFLLVEQAGSRWERTPAWERLERFYQAIKS